MKATEQYFPVVLFIMLYKVVLNFESVAKIVECDHLNETSLAVVLHGAICFSAFFKMKLGLNAEFRLWPLLGVGGGGLQCVAWQPS